MDNNKKHIINGLTSKQEGKSGFTTPKDYFENVENDFFTKLSENSLPNQTGFNTPESYFENLEDTILAKVELPKKEVKVISLKKKIFRIIPMVAAASIVLFIGLNAFIFNKTEENPFDNLADSDVENWISNHINLIEDTDIAFTYTDIDFDESELIPNSISNDELENYLSNQENISLILEND